MELNLERPLAFFDLETTGTDVASDRIVEICIIKVHPDGSEEKYLSRINPTVPIPSEATAIHGISDADVQSAPTFAYKAPEIYQFLENCDLAGYNSNRFDIPLLIEELLRVDENYDLSDRQFVDVQTIFFKMEPRTLAAAYGFYCQKELEDAHSAEADVRATLEVLKGQLDRYNAELKNDVPSLSAFTQGDQKRVDFAGRVVLDSSGNEVFNFGKHRGKRVTAVFMNEPSYYRWMMDSNFPRYTKKVITRIYDRMRATSQP